MYSSLKLTELKEGLRKRGAKVSGKKADLIARLEFYDRNRDDSENFGVVTQTSYIMRVPDPEAYHDVNSSSTLPKITKHQIQSYFDRFNKNIKDAVQLYESRYLLVLRSCQSGQDTFLKGYCKASMKSLQYEVNVKVNQTGMPEEANCECAAGEGGEAHCKHVGVVLLGAENMAKQQIILLNEVSTSKLQKFHQPAKRYYASPLRASRLPSKRNVTKTVFSPYLTKNPHFDKDAYRSRFQSLILNFKSRMPFRQLYPPANKRALNMDHQYTEKSSVDLFLEQMNLVGVTNEKILQIEMDTRGQSKNKTWHSIRCTRITASIFHTVCHLKPQTQKTFSKQILDKKHIQTKAMTHGLVNEKVAIRKYSEMYKVDVVDCGLFLSKERPYLGASPDGLLGSDTIIEVKCPYTSRFREISTHSVPYLELDQNKQFSLKKNNIYYYQIQGQLYVTGRKYCNLIIFTFKSMEVIFIDKDEHFIKEMLKKLDAFYNMYFKEALVNKYFYMDYDNLIKQ